MVHYSPYTSSIAIDQGIIYIFCISFYQYCYIYYDSLVYNFNTPGHQGCWHFYNKHHMGILQLYTGNIIGVEVDMCIYKIILRRKMWNKFTRIMKKITSK